VVEIGTRREHGAARAGVMVSKTRQLPRIVISSSAPPSQ
jgi:hypothetical protein